MRSISCALTSFVLFFMAKSLRQECWAKKGLLIILSLVIIGIAIILMILGM